jgi:hypothetical protein
MAIARLSSVAVAIRAVRLMVLYLRLAVLSQQDLNDPAHSAYDGNFPEYSALSGYEPPPWLILGAILLTRDVRVRDCWCGCAH